jgi:predicted Fe-Mo cluster-binding NifX family protein
MYIAVAAEGPGLENIVSDKFEKCGYLLIVNMDDMSVDPVKNEPALSLAEEILKHDCEAVITGVIEASSFDILADSFITRYLGSGNTVAAALELMEKNQLEVIRNSEGSAGCGGNHHASEK